MRIVLRVVSILALIGLILPPILFLAGSMELDRVKWLMLVATIVWFVTATPVMWKEPGEPDKEETIVP
jgi:nitrate/nitrite transporter NarK